MEGLGKFLTNCIQGNFRPYFCILGPCGSLDATIHISQQTLDAMTISGKFNMERLRITACGEDRNSNVNIVLRLQADAYSSAARGDFKTPEPYVPISGFPQRLFGDSLDKPRAQDTGQSPLLNSTSSFFETPAVLTDEVGPRPHTGDLPSHPPLPPNTLVSEFTSLECPSGWGSTFSRRADIESHIIDAYVGDG